VQLSLFELFVGDPLLGDDAIEDPENFLAALLALGRLGLRAVDRSAFDVGLTDHLKLHRALLDRDATDLGGALREDHALRDSRG
jgi:hypothetical protein